MRASYTPTDSRCEQIGANLEAVVGDLGFTKAKDSIGYISRCGTLKYTAPEVRHEPNHISALPLTCTS